MAFDRISEEIAHFIGMFHLDIEGHRLRLEYESFSIQRSEDELSFPAPPELKVGAPFALKGFDPGLAYLRPAPETPLPPPPPVPVILETITVDGFFLPPPPSLDLASGFVSGQLGGVYVPLPNSILVAIRQTAEMSDNDLLLFTGQTAFIDPVYLTAEFHELIATAQSLAAPALESDAALPRLETMTDLAEALAAFAPREALAEIQLLLREDGLQGTYLNGGELLPLTEPDGAESSEPGTDGAPALLGMTDPAPDRAPATDPATGEEPADEPALPVFTETLPAHLAAKWADPEEDAESPGKDPFTLPRDPTLTPGIDLLDVAPGHKVVTGANLTVNEVTIDQKWVDAPVIAVAGDAIRLDSVSQVNLRQEAPPSGQPGVEALPSTALNAVRIERESNPDPAQAMGGGQPQGWSVVHVEGDLVAVNWIQQHVFATDFDRAEIVITAAATYITTGENIITNAVWLREFGFQYDLILVGGDMITLNQIHQVNVLVDVDVIGGLPEAGVTVSTGDNLQYNLAEIKQTGHDEMVAMKASFQKALDDMAKGKREVSQEVLQDARFEGKAALKVLQVEGDLIKANIIEQKNYLGDSDQIQLMLEDLLDMGEGVTLITGSNAQLNAARLHDSGVDSEVMVAGTAYSDALIYQAQLIDPEAPPTGVALAPLANEAVAFLAEDMIAAERDLDPATAITAGDHPATSDALYAIIT